MKEQTALIAETKDEADPATMNTQIEQLNKQIENL